MQPGARTHHLGCTVLRDATFWPPERWIPWEQSKGWAPNIVQGKTETDPLRLELLAEAMALDERGRPEDLSDRYMPIDFDERSLVLREVPDRYGQGTFRLRLLQAYQGRCAITGEHTRPVLDAAHIQPYRGPRSNHIQNGLLLTKEFHALFDEGYVAITPDYEIRISERLRSEWQNGRRYYPYDHQPLTQLPSEPTQRPSRDALAWHMEHVFR